MKVWIRLTDEYTKGIKDNTRHKIKHNGREYSCVWIEREQCFYSTTLDFGFYMDERDSRPSHILVADKVGEK